MTNFYESYDDVFRIAGSVDKMNRTKWPVAAKEKIDEADNGDGGDIPGDGWVGDGFFQSPACAYWDYGPLAWKVVSCNWSFKQQTSEQQRLEYYEVSVTFQRSRMDSFDSKTMQVLGWPDEWVIRGNSTYDDGTPIMFPQNLDVDYFRLIPSHFPKIVSSGFREKYYAEETDDDGNIPYLGMRNITTDVVYYGCDGEPIEPDKIPTDPDQPTDGPCVQFPRKEPTTEEMPLDHIGRQVPPDTKGVIIIPWMEDVEPIDFVELFGAGPPYAPKKGPLTKEEPEDEEPENKEMPL